MKLIHKIASSIIITLLLSFTVGCRKQEPVISDNPDLPPYTESGRNTGGVLINDTAWLLVEKCFLSLSTRQPLKITSYPNGDSIYLVFDGVYKEDFPFKEPWQIFVVLKNIKIREDNDLFLLKNRSFVLDSINNYGGFIDLSNNVIGRSTGTFSFGNVKVISNITYGDGSQSNPYLHPYIIPGRFEMEFNTDRNHKLSMGRFDVSIVRHHAKFSVVE